MKIPKATEADRARFQSLLPDDSRIEVKPMFGNLGAFVNGNMFSGLFGAAIGVRLDDADRAALATRGGGAFGPEGRPMRGYVSLPEPLLVRRADAAKWVGKALEYVAGLPPKRGSPGKGSKRRR